MVTLAQTCKKAGIKLGTVKGRLYYGWTLNEAVDTPTLSRQEVLNRALNGRKNILKYKGKSLLQWCRETGVNYKTAYSRVKQGYSIKEAIDKNLKQRRYLIDGKPMRQVLGAKKAQQVYRRMNEGWSFEDAVTVPTVDPVEAGKAGYYMARKLGYL